MAIRGRLLPELLAVLLGHAYFRQKPPKTAGREQFGPAMAEMVLAWGRRNRARPEDLVHTATLLTPVSILDAFRRWIEPRTRVAQVIVSGGGAHNPLMTTHLQAGLPGMKLVHSEDLGVVGDAKEAFAFAILAYEAYHGRPNNLPSATGAKHPATLGKIIHAPAR
jgi:anhydro-N-acetylmuramic acid kinase